MKRGILSGLALVTCLVVAAACSSSGKGAKSSDDAENVGGQGGMAKEESGMDDVEQKDISSEQKGARKDEEPSPTSGSVKDNPEPEFKEGGSVNDAINAVPQGLPRENVELDELNKPLNDPAVYEPCKLNPSSHFEIKFAVWGGRCVGLDIKTTPKNPTLETCLREVVGKAKWRDKTKSLNISTVSF